MCDQIMFYPELLMYLNVALEYTYIGGIVPALTILISQSSEYVMYNYIAFSVGHVPVYTTKLVIIIRK